MSGAWRNDAFTVATATALCPASCSAHARAAAISSSVGTTLLTSPMRAASSASTQSPSSASSAALPGPTRRGSSQLAPVSRPRPWRTNSNENRARSLATTRSHPRARLTPAPTAGPSTAAITGFGHSCSATAVRPKRRITVATSSPLGRLGARSPPDENAPPAPVSTTTRSSAPLADLDEQGPQRLEQLGVEGVAHLGPVHRGGHHPTRALDHEHRHQILRSRPAQ